MKTLFTFLVLLSAVMLYAQAPQKMSYHALIKNESDGVFKNKNITLKTSIRYGSPDGEPVFIELHQASTSKSGIVSVSIGAGENVMGTFEEIDWGKGNYFITSEADLDGDNIFSEISIQELLSVPYAFYAEHSKNAGPEGKSAYDLWLEQGNRGTVDDFLRSLIGPAGKDCDQNLFLSLIHI